MPLLSLNVDQTNVATVISILNGTVVDSVPDLEIPKPNKTEPRWTDQKVLVYTDGIRTVLPLSANKIKMLEDQSFPPFTKIITTMANFYKHASRDSKAAIDEIQE